MAFGKKILSSLKNAFDHAVHGEGTADRARKLGVAQSVIEFSAPLTTDGSADYESRLRAVLLQAPTKALDALVEKKIAVGIDARLSKQTLADRDAPIAGVFYPGPQNGAEGGLATFAESSQSGALIGKLATLLQSVKPTVPVFAYSTTEIAMGGDMGMAFPVTLTEWGVNGNDKAPAAQKNPALKTPPAPPAPKN